jgi:hypothetical protein
MVAAVIGPGSITPVREIPAAANRNRLRLVSMVYKFDLRVRDSRFLSPLSYLKLKEGILGKLSHYELDSI